MGHIIIRKLLCKMCLAKTSEERWLYSQAMISLDFNTVFFWREEESICDCCNVTRCLSSNRMLYSTSACDLVLSSSHSSESNGLNIDFLRLQRLICYNTKTHNIIIASALKSVILKLNSFFCPKLWLKQGFSA